MKNVIIRHENVIYLLENQPTLYVRTTSVQVKNQCGTVIGEIMIPLFIFNPDLHQIFRRQHWSGCPTIINKLKKTIKAMSKDRSLTKGADKKEAQKSLKEKRADKKTKKDLKSKSSE